MLVLVLLVVVAVLIFTYVQKGNVFEQKLKNDCINNLLKIEVAKLYYAISGGLPLTNGISERAIFGEFGLKPFCPSRGIYYVGKTVGDPPSCTIPGHTL